MNYLRIVVFILLLLTLPHTLFGSDRAGPIKFRKAEASMTELFAFPEAKQLIAALNSSRGLTESPPYNLAPFDHTIYIDLDSNVTYDHMAGRVRYGGALRLGLPRQHRTLLHLKVLQCREQPL